MLLAEQFCMSQKAGSPQEIAVALPQLREHVQELVESPAFKGSRRCQQFLQYVVDKAIAGQIDDLKERSLGVSLFGRSPSYDTGEDAIVRVTASDVRRRLNQYYSEKESGIRIDLPAGSYSPEFRTQPIRESAAPPAPVTTPRPPSPQDVGDGSGDCGCSGDLRRLAVSSTICRRKASSAGDASLDGRLS